MSENSHFYSLLNASNSRLLSIASIKNGINFRFCILIDIYRISSLDSTSRTYGHNVEIYFHSNIKQNFRDILKIYIVSLC